MDIIAQISKEPSQQSKYNLLIQKIPSLLKSEVEGDGLVVFLVKLIKLRETDNHAEVVHNVTTNIHCLANSNRENDWILSLILSLAYQSMKKLNDYDLRFFCNLFIINTKYNNKRCCLMLNNIILKILIEKKMFKYAANYLNHDYRNDSKYNFYKGIVECVSTKYKDALASFTLAMVLSNKYTNKIRKYECVTRMLLGKVDKNYKWSNSLLCYKEISDCVRMGEREQLQKLIDEYKSVFWEDKTYFLVCRLHHVILQESIRRISLVYSRISLADIQSKFGISEHLFRKFIDRGKVCGSIQDDIYVSEPAQKTEPNIRLMDTLRLNDRCQDKMTYPKIKKICYESYVKGDENKNK